MISLLSLTEVYHAWSIDTSRERPFGSARPKEFSLARLDCITGADSSLLQAQARPRFSDGVPVFKPFPTLVRTWLHVVSFHVNDRYHRLVNIGRCGKVARSPVPIAMWVQAFSDCQPDARQGFARGYAVTRPPAQIVVTIQHRIEVMQQTVPDRLG